MIKKVHSYDLIRYISMIRKRVFLWLEKMHSYAYKKFIPVIKKGVLLW